MISQDALHGRKWSYVNSQILLYSYVEGICICSELHNMSDQKMEKTALSSALSLTGRNIFSPAVYRNRSHFCAGIPRTWVGHSPVRLLVFPHNGEVLDRDHLTQFLGLNRTTTGIVLRSLKRRRFLIRQASGQDHHKLSISVIPAGKVYFGAAGSVSTRWRSISRSSAINP